MKYFSYQTEQEALNKCAELDEQLGYPKYGISALTGEVNYSAITLKWAEPILTATEVYVVPSPYEDQGVDEDPAWWAYEGEFY